MRSATKLDGLAIDRVEDTAASGDEVITGVAEALNFDFGACEAREVAPASERICVSEAIVFIESSFHEGKALGNRSPMELSELLGSLKRNQSSETLFWPIRDRF